MINIRLDLENDLILSFIFFSRMQKIASGGLITSFEKFGLNLYFKFLQKIFVEWKTPAQKYLIVYNFTFVYESFLVQT